MTIYTLIKQKPYETIKYFLRQHIITFIPTLVLFVALEAIPVILYFLATTLYPGIFSGQILLPIAVLCTSIYYLSLCLFFYSQFVEFYLDIWVVTNDRIVDVEQKGLFARTITEMDLYRIQDVTVEVNGFFPTMFHYGDVHVKTASSNSLILFRNVSHPNEVRQALVQLAEEDRKYHHGQDV